MPEGVTGGNPSQVQGVEVHALAAEGATGLADVAIKVAPGSSPEVRTGSDGKIQIPLEPGKYTIAAPAAPTGRAPAEAADIEVTAGKLTPVELRFPKLSQLEVKVESSAPPRSPISPAKVTLTGTSVSGSAEAETNQAGIAVFDNLAPGAYVGRVVDVPDGYREPTVGEKPTTLAPGDAGQLMFECDPISSLVVKVRDDLDKPVGGARVTVARVSDGKVVYENLVPESGDLDVPNLTLGTYKVTQVSAPVKHVLPPEGQRTVTVAVVSGTATPASFTNARTGQLTITAVKKSEPTAKVGGGAVTLTDQSAVTTQVIIGADGAKVLDLAPGTYTVEASTPPPGFDEAEPRVQPVTISSGANIDDFKLLHTEATSAAEPRARYFGLSCVALALLAIWGVGVGIKGHWDQLGATVVLFVGLGLLTAIARRPYGFFRAVIGDDKRLSTSKVQVGIWTIAVVWALGLLFAHVLWEEKGTDLTEQATGTEQADREPVIPDDVWGDYLILLGGPFAALVLAKGITTWKVENGSLQKTINESGKAEIKQVLADDEGHTDLVDSQYLLFNVVALGWFIAALIDEVELPSMPPVLLALTSGAAALYVSNKAAGTNKPTITGVTPATVRPGDSVTITGQNFRPAGASDTDPVRAELEGFGPLRVTRQLSSSIVAEIPEGAPAGTRNVLVTTATGVVTDPWPVTVNADQAQIVSFVQPEAMIDDPITIIGRQFRSALDSGATTAAVWFGESSVPGQLGDRTDGLDEVTATVPPTATGSQVNVAVQSTRGARSAPLTLALLTAPQFVQQPVADRLIAGKVRLTMKVKGFLKHTGVPTVSNKVLVDEADVAAFHTTPGLDRVTTLVAEADLPANTLSIAVRVLDHLGRSSDVVSVPLPPMP